MGIRFRRERPTPVLIIRAVGEASQHIHVVCRVNHHRHGGMVFCRGTNKCWPADVYIFNHLVVRRARSQRLAKRIEIHHHEVKRLNPQIL